LGRKKVGSISQNSIQLKRAAQLSKHILVGRVLEKSTFRFPGTSDFPASPPGKDLHYFRIRSQRTLKGPDVPAGGDLWIFSWTEWFHHTHAEVIKAGVISYEDLRFSEGIAEDQVKPGMSILFFLNGESAPAGFPPGALFMGFGEAHARSSRARAVVAALRDGSDVGFDHLILMKKGDHVRFPDDLEIHLLAHSHKRSRVEGPWKEWIDLELSKGGKRVSMSLDHCTDPDLSETWDTKTWGPYSIEVKAMDVNKATLVVRKNSPP
jgi:hypothetical protein